MLCGRAPVLPGNAVAISMIAPALFEWWLRPVSNATRVGEQSAVVWKRLYFRPWPARRSSVGIGMPPPKVLAVPKPMSSIRKTITFGAPFGALTAKRGGAVALRASSSVAGGGVGSGVGLRGGDRQPAAIARPGRGGWRGGGPRRRRGATTRGEADRRSCQQHR